MRVITQGRARFKVNSNGIYWRDMLKHAEQYHHTPIADVDAYRESMRVSEVEELLKKAAKFRKPTVSRGSRKYPPNGASLSTRDYVLDYFSLNHQYTGHEVAGFFEPLTRRITPIHGHYTEVHES